MTARSSTTRPGKIKRRRPRSSEAARRRALKRIVAGLIDAQRRAYVARRFTQGATTNALASEMGIPRKLVDAYFEHALARLRTLGPHFRGSPLNDSDMPRRRVPLGGLGPGPHVKGSPKGAPIVVYDGEIIDPPDEAAFKQEAYELRKRSLPYDQIAKATGRSQEDCRRAVRQVLQSLERDELQDTALAKRMMLEQIDSMIAAITLPATGHSDESVVVFNAIDRMVKLLDRKAKLLGLDAPQRVDLNHRIEVLAEETGYDVEELRDIAQDVLRAYSARSLS